jgi:hypothetical protein
MLCAISHLFNLYHLLKNMALINYADLTGAALRGHSDDKVNVHDGTVLVERIGYAKITSTLQTNIPIFLPSSGQTIEEININPDKRLVLPVGAVITNIALRLPRLETNTNTPQYGNLPVGSTLVGTTGELVKVAADGVFTTTAPSIASVSNAYAPNSAAIASRPIATPADVAASSLITVSSATNLSLVVSNAGNSAAGTGIRTSSGVGFAIVRVCWFEPLAAPTYEELGFLTKSR